ncbi:hypothetical protein M1328_00690 [Patescibacteria group bacterium]|nr:hypothetical protein [Patescibacteria group bacterium]
MQIPISFIGYKTTKKSSDLLYIKILFKYLQEDKEFENMIVNIRKKLNIGTTSLKGTGKVEIKERALLRSEFINFKKKKIELKPNPRAESFSSNDERLEKEVDNIIKIYVFLKDWNTGLRKYILDNVFPVTTYNTSIKLRIRYKNMYFGSYSDLPFEEGAKIVISAPITKKQLVEFYKEYKEIINAFLNQKNKATLSKRDNFERDRLIVYLRNKTNKSWKEIADILQEKANQQLSEEALQEAYKDFPFNK